MADDNKSNPANNPNAPSVGAAALGAGASFLGSAIGYGFNKELQKDAQRFATKQMYEQNRLNLDNQRLAPKNMVDGYQMAGLSPALAANGNFTPVSTSATSAGTNSASSPDLVNAIFSSMLARKQLDVMDAQKSKIESDKENVDEDTHGKQLDNMDKENNQKSTNTQFRVMLNNALNDEKCTPFEKKIYREMLNSDTVFTKGSFEGWLSGDDFKSKRFAYVRQIAEDKFLSLVREGQINNGIARIVAEMPKFEQKEIIGKIFNLAAMTAEMNSKTALNYGEVQKIPEQIRKIQADVEATIVKYKKDYHEDLTQMLENHDVLGSTVKISGEAFQAILDVIETFVDVKKAKK